MYSKITDKYQTTIPKEIREKLKLTRGDFLEWQYRDGTVTVKPAGRDFLKYKGAVSVGAGDIDDDIDRAKRHSATSTDIIGSV